MKNIKINDKSYHVVKDEFDIINEADLNEMVTEYYEPFDYIVGDIAYSKLRLKGFYKSNHKDCQKMNNYDFVDDYIKEKCAYGCKYFIIEKD